MNNIIVYCETDGGRLCDVSLELMTKARDLAAELSCDVEALLIGHNVKGLAAELYAYGAKLVHLADDSRLEHFRTLPYAAITIDLFRREKPQIALFGATSVGRDLAPRVSSALHSGLTADCTALEIGDHQDKEKQYHNLLYQIRPAFGGNIIATIVNPEHRPQMATVREGVMKKAPLASPVAGSISEIDVKSIIKDSDLTVEIVAREIEERKIDSCGRRLCGPCPPDRTDRCDRASQALHLLRYLRPDPAYCRHGPVFHDHLDQQRSGGSYPQDSRLCYRGRPQCGDSQTHQVLQTKQQIESWQIFIQTTVI